MTETITPTSPIVIIPPLPEPVVIGQGDADAYKRWLESLDRSGEEEPHPDWPGRARSKKPARMPNLLPLVREYAKTLEWIQREAPAGWCEHFENQLAAAREAIAEGK